MKKGWLNVLALMMTAVLLSGCGSDKRSGGDAEKYVTLGEYKGIEVNISQTDEAINVLAAQYYFNNVAERVQITDRAVKPADLANIDYEGKKDGVAFGGGTAQGAELLIGSGQFIGGFEDGLIGVMPGETVDLNLRFPDGYGNTELAGQEVVFTVKVNFISEMQDEQIPGIGIADVANVEQLKQYVRDSEYREQAETAVMEKIMAETEFGELPAAMLDESRQLYVDFLDQMAQMYGMDGKTFVTVQGMDYETLLGEYAEEHTKQRLVLQAIADRENLNLSKEDFNSRVEEYAESVGMTAAEIYERGVTEDNLRESFLYEDVMAFLVENAVNTAAK